MSTPRLLCPSAALAALAAVAALALTGCADEQADDRSSPSPRPTTSEGGTVDADRLIGETFVSTAVEGHDLVQGTQIMLTFEDTTMSVSAGCNTMFGAYTIEASGILRWAGAPAATLIGCPDDLTAQDQWLTTLFTEGLSATADGADLTLTADDVVIRLSPQSSDDLTALFGRIWSLVGIITGEATSPLHRRASRPSLSVRADGLARLNTGCNGGRTTVRIDGDQLVFGHAVITRRACTGAAGRVEQALLAVVDQGRTDHVEVRDRVLILRRGGDGLVFELDQPRG